jgi:Tol biopolymer transport system component
LVAGDENGLQDIFVYDLQTGAVARVSLSSSGIEADGPSYRPSISADGRMIAFHSDAKNLVDGEHTIVRHAYVHDRVNHTTTRISGNALVEGDLEGDSPKISGDGCSACFLSRSTTLSPDDDPGVLDVFVRDLVTGSLSS